MSVVALENEVVDAYRQIRCYCCQGLIDHAVELAMEHCCDGKKRYSYVRFRREYWRIMELPSSEVNVIE